jgi:hypothetical protein
MYLDFSCWKHHQTDRIWQKWQSNIGLLDAQISEGLTVILTIISYPQNLKTGYQ